MSTIGTKCSRPKLWFWQHMGSFQEIHTTNGPECCEPHVSQFSCKVNNTWPTRTYCTSPRNGPCWSIGSCHAIHQAQPTAAPVADLNCLVTLRPMHSAHALNFTGSFFCATIWRTAFCIARLDRTSKLPIFLNCLITRTFQMDKLLKVDRTEKPTKSAK